MTDDAYLRYEICVQDVEDSSISNLIIGKSHCYDDEGGLNHFSEASGGPHRTVANSPDTGISFGSTSLSKIDKLYADGYVIHQGEYIGSQFIPANGIIRVHEFCVAPTK
jgi:hypothetical protein